MTAEMYFDQIGTLSRRIVYHRERLYRMRSEADAVFSHWGETVSSGKKDAPYVRMMERIEECSEELEKEDKLLAGLQRQAEETISRLPDENHRLVLLYRYLEGMSYMKIAVLMHVDKSTAKRRHASALEKLVLPENPIRIS